MAQLTAPEWALVQSAMPKAKAQRTAKELAAMDKYRAAGKPAAPRPGSLPVGANRVAGTGGRAYALAHGLDPNTGLPPGMNPNRPVSGSNMGQTMPRGGRVRDPRKEKSLKGKDKLAQLSLMLLDDPTTLTQYGAEEGIYGQGGYKKWNKDFSKALKKAGLPDYTPEQWAKMMGYDAYNTPGAVKGPKDTAFWRKETDSMIKKLKKKGLGGVPDLAGSGPFDVGAYNPEGQVMLMNQALGTQYKTMDEAMTDLAPLAGWADAKYNSLTFEERQNPTPQTQALLHISKLGPGYGKEDEARYNKAGDRGPTNFLLDDFFKAPKKQQKQLLKELGMVKESMPTWMKDAYQKVSQTEAAKKYGTDRVFFDALAKMTSPDAGFNWKDPTAPLFRMTKGGQGGAGASGGSIPGKLLGEAAQLGVDERYLGSLSAEEFITEYAPMALMAEKDPEWRAAHPIEKVMMSGADDSNMPLKDLPSFQRFRALKGMAAAGGRFNPGTAGNSFISRLAYGASKTAGMTPRQKREYESMVGMGALPDVESTGWPSINLQDINSPEEWAAAFSDLPTNDNLAQWRAAHGGRIPDYLYNGVPGYQNFWNSSAVSGFAPWQTGDDAMRRLIGSMGGATGSGGEQTF